MKTVRYILLLLLAGSLLFTTAMAGRKDRIKKLQVGSYITSAKIEILSGKPERIKAALVYLNDLASFYGPHSEAYYWKSQIYVDYIEKASGGVEKQPHVKNFVLYSDSLRLSCGNKDIKKKYRKNCEKFSSQIDSIKVKYWREFYNYGVEKLDEIAETTTDMKDDPDSASQVYYQEKINSIRDTALSYFELSLIIDSTDPKGWMGLSQLYSQTGDLGGANDMLKKSLAVSPEENRPNLLIQIAYNYINDQKYCEAIPSLKEYVESAGSEDADNMMNLGAIYNRCGKIDSAYAVYQKIISFDPENVDALVASGRYHNQQAIWAYDSVRYYDELKDDAGSSKWKEHRVAEFGEAKNFLESAFEHADTTDATVAGEYGLVLILVGNYEKAIIPFERLTALKPTDKNNWTTLGDCYLKMQDFENSARAYEHVVELDPDNKPVWESLAALYLELKEPEKRKNAQSHLN